MTASAASLSAPSARGAAFWTTQVLTAIVVVFLLADASMKLLALPIVLETQAQLGYSTDLTFTRGLGLVLLACVALYLHQRTMLLGAVLLTAFFGGTVATHVRVGSPVLTHALFGVYLAVVLLANVYVRDPRIRALLPLRAGA